jgi:phosphate-selective porin OprO/OprP
MKLRKGKWEMRIRKSIASIVGSVLLAAFSAHAQESNTNTTELIQQLLKKIDALEQKVQALEQHQSSQTNDAQQIRDLGQQVKVLERNRELESEAAAAKAKETPAITIGKDGFAIESPDKENVIQLKGVLQVDSRTFFGDSGTVGNDSLLLRRARPILQGTLLRDFDFQFVPDFGGTSPQIFDAWLNYRYNPALQLQAGKFKSPVGLEQLQADADLNFNERALPTSLVPNRDIGFALHGDLFQGIANYTAGIFNGIGDARNSSNLDFEDNKAAEGRLFFQPFKTTSLDPLKGFGFGVSGSYESMQGTNVTGLPSTTGGTLAGYVTDGQQQFFAYNPANTTSNRAVVVADGEHWRLSPQAYYYYGPFGFLAEYVISDQHVARVGTIPARARLENTAWEVTGSWILTGEDASFKGGVSPRHPFNPKQGGWGAWQLVARYAELKIDDGAFPLYSDPNTSAHSAASWSIGLNWWLNRNVRVLTSFSHTDFQGGGGSGASAPASVTRKDENMLFTRLQLSF